VTGQYTSEPTQANYALWTTDGTANGTNTIAIPGPSIIQYLELVASTGAQAFFRVLRFGAPESGLWITDGTAAGTRLVRGGLDIGYGSLGLVQYEPPGISFGAGLLFQADDGRTGFELWSSDGTSNGTRVVRDINALPQLDAPALAPDVPRYIEGSTTYVGPRPTFVGSAPAGATVVLFDWYGEIGRGVAIEGAYTITPAEPFPYNSADVSAVVAAPNGDASLPTWPARNELRLGIDRYGPYVQHPIRFDDSPPHRVTINFNEPVQQSFSTENVVVRNVETGVSVRASDMAITFENNGYRMEITFPGFAGGRLSRGDYELTIARERLTDRVGNLSVRDLVFMWSVRRFTLPIGAVAHGSRLSTLGSPRKPILDLAEPKALTELL
jgi:ELWxxDGT repeat protein